VVEIGHLSSAYYWRHGKSMWTLEIGERVFAYKCENCGYIELYKEMKEKK